MLLKRLFAFALTTTLFIPVMAQEQSHDLAYVQKTNEAASLCDQAVRLGASNDYTRAFDLYTKASALDPNRNSANVHCNFGILLENMNRLDESITEFNKALQFDANLLPSKRGLASALLSKGIQLSAAKQYEQAKPCYNRALAIEGLPDSDLANAHTGYAVLLEKMGNLDEALAQNKTALELDPRNKTVICNIASCYEHLGDVEQAKKYLNQYLNEFPNEPNRNFVLATLDSLNRKKSQVNEKQDSKDYIKDVTAEGIEVWPKQAMPLKVFIPAGSNMAGYRDSFAQILQASFDQWMQAASGYLSWTLVRDPNYANIVCRWTNNHADLKHQGAEQGETERNYRRAKHGECMLTHASIDLCFVDPMSGNIISDNVARSLCLHEIGHALGLKGHSPNRFDVMFYATGEAFPITNLSPRDIDTINRLYKTYQSKLE